MTKQATLDLREHLLRAVQLRDGMTTMEICRVLGLKSKGYSASYSSVYQQLRALDHLGAVEWSRSFGNKPTVWKRVGGAPDLTTPDGIESWLNA